MCFSGIYRPLQCCPLLSQHCYESFFGIKWVMLAKQPKLNWLSWLLVAILLWHKPFSTDTFYRRIFHYDSICDSRTWQPVQPVYWFHPIAAIIQNKTSDCSPQWSTQRKDGQSKVQINRITLSLVSVARLYKVCGCVLVTLLSATACYNFYLPGWSRLRRMRFLLLDRQFFGACSLVRTGFRGKDPAPLRCEQEKPVLIRL